MFKDTYYDYRALSAAEAIWASHGELGMQTL